MKNSQQSYTNAPPDWRSYLEGKNIGFVFGASGAKYTALAHQAAVSVKQIHPNIPVDLYTDQEVSSDVYDQVHQLEKTWFRPKFEAISRSRFDWTIYLDADLVVVADISDVFWLLGKYDLAAAHVEGRNTAWANQVWRTPLPNAFPQINGGVMGVRKNDRTKSLMAQVAAALHDFDLKMDQFALRELIWLSDVSLYILPPEYNVRSTQGLVRGGPSSAAPRVLHSSRFHKKMAGSDQPPSPQTVYGSWRMKFVRYRLRLDKQLTSTPIKASWLNFFKS